jgi:hypothetical protein
MTDTSLLAAPSQTGGDEGEHCASDGSGQETRIRTRAEEANSWTTDLPRASSTGSEWELALPLSPLHQLVVSVRPQGFVFPQTRDEENGDQRRA